MTIYPFKYGDIMTNGRAEYIERCTFGSEEGNVKPILVTRKGVCFLSYASNLEEKSKEDNSMMLKERETEELNIPNQSPRSMRYMVKTILPESQTYGLKPSDYPLQLMGNKEVTDRNTSVLSVVRHIFQYPIRINGRTRHLNIVHLTGYVIQGIPKWKRQLAMNLDSENSIWYRSSSSTQRLPVTGLAWGSRTGWFDIQNLKES